MKHSALLLLCFLVVLACASCERYVTADSRFWKVISTDYEGNVIAEWIAVGWPQKIKGGVRILAIEKKVHSPYPLEARYVIGRRVEVLAANVAYFRTPAPAWLRKTAVASHQRTSVTSYTK